MFLRPLHYKHRKQLQRAALESRWWSLFVLLFLLSYSCILKVRKTILHFHFYMRAGWNLSLINLINTSSSAQLFSQAIWNQYNPINQPSSLLLELIDRFLYEANTGFKLIKIQLCKAKGSVMRVGSRTPATSKVEFFMASIKK